MFRCGTVKPSWFGPWLCTRDRSHLHGRRIHSEAAALSHAFAPYILGTNKAKRKGFLFSAGEFVARVCRQGGKKKLMTYSRIVLMPAENGDTVIHQMVLNRRIE